MHSRMKIIKAGERITLVAQNGGKAMAWLLLLEMALLGGLIALLSAVLPSIESLLLPVIASFALILWTAVQIKSDYRITMDLGTRQGLIVRIAAITGEHTEASFPIDDVECLTLQQMVGQAARKPAWKEYVVAIELRSGARHVLSTRGPLLAYQESVARFSRAAGLGSRVVRLPAT